MKLASILAIAALAVPACAMAQSKAEVFSGKDVTSQLETLMQAAKTSGSGRVGPRGSVAVPRR